MRRTSKSSTRPLPTADGLIGEASWSTFLFVGAEIPKVGVGLRVDQIVRLRVGAIRWQTTTGNAGEPVDMLLAYRGVQLGEKYVNRVLMPPLCRKAGVPREDVPGAITSHRACATIASQLSTPRTQ